ncbi:MULTISPECIES: FadR/GntR family transcriptional regulator [unclassified Roseitalea]|uniref:FadR/GntR family transcriptional regulator n=1 Tax=unclassified Roseitalea TaxID=2639107 RepID=UPI00273E3449|nr:MULTISPECIES: FadR/GntR family transcriptional regulator [unclassified Roseitalea]
MEPAEAFEVETIRRESVTGIVVDRLLGYVSAGKLAAGERLPPERRLAEMFGVSRPTIREALRALSVLGVLEVRHGGGVFVSRLDAADLLQPLTFFLTLQDVTVEKLYAARRLIEGEIAALAAVNAGSGHLARLDALLDEQKQVLDDPSRYRQVDTDFHAHLAHMADNPFLMRAAQSLNMLGLEFRKIASETPAVLAGSVGDHEAIVDALKAGDAEAARAAMAAHMDFVLDTTKACQAEQP